MDVAELANVASNAGTLVAVLYVLVKRPPDSGISDRWVRRLERALDSCLRREASRERRDGAHRAWDSAVLSALTFAHSLEEARAAVADLGHPPRLTPDPMEWQEPEQPERRVAVQRARTK